MHFQLTRKYYKDIFDVYPDGVKGTEIIEFGNEYIGNKNELPRNEFRGIK